MAKSGRGMGVDQLVGGLKAAGEPTRLRILALLAERELTVKDLTRILAQSQPRVSRHLKLLAEAQMLARSREGSWVYFRLSDTTTAGHMARQLVGSLAAADPDIQRDRVRAQVIADERTAAAHAYFAAHAAEWDRIRALHVPEAAVEQAIIDLVGSETYRTVIDLGTGTGRMIEILSPFAERLIGVDANPAMLDYARAKMSAALGHKVQLRLGDLYCLPLDEGGADLVVLHQVLHFLTDPSAAIAAAARLLRPGGRLLVVDFAAHDLDFLREDYAHQRLGFEPQHIAAWLRDAGAEPIQHQTLAPLAESQPLTVLIWLAERRAPAITRTEPSTLLNPAETMV